MSDFKAVFDSNLQRVDSLIAMYSQVKGTEQSDKNKDYRFTDMLRAAVVFLHSAFEEYFRNIITVWLPVKGTKELLKSIVLPDDAGKNGVKYSLSDLLLYKDKTVGEIFQESVAEFMSRSSFNSYSEIYSWGTKIGLTFKSFDKQKDIDKAVQRRHKIVHEADIELRSTRKQIKGIKEADIAQWRQAYSELVEMVESQVDEWKKPSDREDLNHE